MPWLVVGVGVEPYLMMLKIGRSLWTDTLSYHVIFPQPSDANISNSQILPMLFYNFVVFHIYVAYKDGSPLSTYMLFVCQDNSADTISIELMNGND